MNLIVNFQSVSFLISEKHLAKLAVLLLKHIFLLASGKPKFSCFIFISLSFISQSLLLDSPVFYHLNLGGIGSLHLSSLATLIPQVFHLMQWS